MKSNRNNISSGQAKLARLIQRILNNPEVLLEVTWKWLISDKGQNLFVDIYIPKHKLCIEYQGQQHYFYPNRFHKTYNEFLDQRRRDKIKRELLKKHGFRYLAWRYSEPLTLKHVVERLERLRIPIPEDIRRQATAMPERKYRKRWKKLNKSKKPVRKC